MQKVNLSENLKNEFKSLVITENFSEPVLQVSKDELTGLLTHLRDNKNLRFRQLIDILGVDYPKRENRFDVIYLLLSHEFNNRITVKVSIKVNEKDKIKTNIIELIKGIVENIKINIYSGISNKSKTYFKLVDILEK